MTIRYAKTSDAGDVEVICHTAFCKTSIDTDIRLSASGGDYLYRYYAKRAIEHYPGNCLIAERSGHLAGFIIFGTDADMGKRIGKKIANIILLAVAPADQGRGIGSRLVRAVLEYFRTHRFSLIYVGTDADNTAALRTYERNGFHTVLNWGTFRRYGLQPTDGENPLDTKTLDVDIEKRLSAYDITRTHSFFFDHHLPLEKVRAHNLAFIAREAEKKAIAVYELLHNRKPAGFFSLRTDGWLTEFTGTRFSRIDDCHIVPECRENAVIVRAAVDHAVRTTCASADVLEAWSALNRFSYIDGLTANGFSFIHAASVLHLWL
ncbi:MAG: GNAT family N-acetyltransferase [Spirochaetota bacterium]